MESVVFLPGQKINLCVLDPNNDLTLYMSWMNDKSITKYLETGFFPSDKAGLIDYIGNCNNLQNLFLGIFVKENQSYIGNIRLHNINFVSRRGDIGILIGDSNIHGKGYGLEAIQLIVDYAFQYLNLNKVCAGANIENPASIRIFEKAGFVVEGTLRQQFYVDGRYTDCVQMGLLKSEYNNISNH
tara:strand:+ start:92 stop:646 length:555 start_codon:yes stop_codon:yes gene_type:complete